MECGGVPQSTAPRDAAIPDPSKLGGKVVGLLEGVRPSTRNGFFVMLPSDRLFAELQLALQQLIVFRLFLIFFSFASLSYFL